MNIIDWLNEVTNNETYSRIAAKAGLNSGTLKPQYERAEIPPKSIVAIARAYSVSPLTGFVAAGLITEEEANIKAEDVLSSVLVLRSVSDVELIEELLRRIQGGGELAHPELFTPLDENHPAMQAIDADVVELPPREEMAAKHDPYDIDAEDEAPEFP